MKNRVFNRSEANPILTPLSVPIPAAAVLNPGATEQDGEVVLLLRVEDKKGFSSIHTARSRNGVDNWTVDDKPILGRGEPGYIYETWGCEDARVTYIAEEERWYITYTGYSGYGAAVALARTDDLVQAQRIGLIFSPPNKDAVLFPQKVSGQWAILHRPGAGGKELIWSAYSPDLIHWGDPHCLVQEIPGASWIEFKLGAGPPPVLVDSGWLVIYHGVKAYGGQLVYRAGVALLDKDRPHKPLAASSNWIFQAEADYERSGFIPNVVFPTGLLLRGDELWMYYGAGDVCTCLAVAKLDDVLGELDLTF